MSQSPLVTRQWWASPNNYTVGRQGSNLWGIVIHHAASTSLDSVGNTFANPSRQASAHYGVKGNQIHQYVAEENGAWHCGDYWGNMGTIGIETVNSTGAPNWLVDDETFETLARLVADIAKRNGLGRLKFEPDGYCPNLSAHRDWSATACPGDYLYGKMYELAERANNINYPPAPSVVWCDHPYPVMVTNKPTNLVELPSKKVVKSYPAGERIESLCQYAFVDGKAYLRTEYSKINNKNNGFLEVDLSVYEEPKPEPEPAPEPEPEPTPGPTPDPEPTPVDDTPNWFIRFIQALGEFFTNLFKKK